MNIHFKNICIVGVGLMGGSFALALKAQGFKGKITGIGRTRKNLIKAKRLGVIDFYTTEYKAAVQNADLVLLATPVGWAEPIVRKIRQHLKKGAIVTDVGSVKSRIVKKIEPLMPKGMHFVGAHPIAGRECSGIECATAELYRNARCIITPGAHTDKKALKKVVQLWKAVGSKVVLMEPEKHDMIFAEVSHLPHVVAYALVNSIAKTENNILHHGGKGLRDMTRIALSSPELWRDICEHNRKNLLNSLRNFSSHVSHLTHLIQRSDWPGLENEFSKAKEARQILE
ncbi:MAG: prephenate dehydrogenase [Nitrospiraceae bacterium]|nr:MAG: prephenate dehydrogenase [Nitrospiraceae bacterium]